MGGCAGLHRLPLAVSRLLQRYVDGIAAPHLPRAGLHIDTRDVVVEDHVVALKEAARIDRHHLEHDLATRGEQMVAIPDHPAKHRDLHGRDPGDPDPHIAPRSGHVVAPASVCARACSRYAMAASAITIAPADRKKSDEPSSVPTVLK